MQPEGRPVQPEVVPIHEELSPAERLMLEWPEEEEKAEQLAEPPLKTEIRLYQSMAKSKRSDMDVLEWWKVNQETFPLLAALARRYLCIPATSAPSEILLSTAENNMTFSRYKPFKNKSETIYFLTHIVTFNQILAKTYKCNPLAPFHRVPTTWNL